MTFPPQEQIESGSDLGEHHGVEGSWSELKAGRYDSRWRGSARSARADLASARRTGLAQASLRLAMGRAESGVSRRCQG